MRGWGKYDQQILGFKETIRENNPRLSSLLLPPFFLLKSWSILSQAMQAHRLPQPWRIPLLVTPVRSPHSIFYHSLLQLAHRGPTPLSPCMCVLGCFNHVWLSADPWTIAHQAPLSVGFSRQEYWSGWPCPPPGDLPNPGIELASLKSPALAGGFLFFFKPLVSLGNPFLPVWLSYYGCNKWWQTYWLKTTPIYHLIVWEVRSLDIRVLAILLQEALEENGFPCLFQL